MLYFSSGSAPISSSWVLSISGSWARSRLLPLTLPARELSLQVARSATEIAQTDGVGVGGVQGRERVDHRMTEWDTLVDRDGGGGDRTVVEHDAVDEVHHVERGPVHGVVGTQAKGRRAGDGRRSECRDHPVFAFHVVSGGEHGGQGWAAQHESAPVGVGDPECQIAVTAGDGGELQRRCETVDRFDHPGGDRTRVDTGNLALVRHPRRSSTVNAVAPA